MDSPSPGGRLVFHVFAALAIVELQAHQAKAQRKAMRRLLLRGQERIHFKKESDARRGQIWSEIERWTPSIKVHVVTSSHRYQSEARGECLTELTRLAPRVSANLVVIERDEGPETGDRDTLPRGLRGTGISWELQPPRADALLWVADAAAWLWTHPQRRWRDRVDPYVEQVIRL